MTQRMAPAVTRTRLRAEAPTAPPPFVLIGGIPGAGKSTALQRLEPLLPGVRFLDSDTQRRWIAQHAPRAPYKSVRPLVHLIHHVRVLILLLAGPGRSAGVIVHDPSTRWLRLGVVGRLARLRGWDPEVLFVDISWTAAIAGQRQRGRMVHSRRFGRHWRRWQPLRATLDPRSTVVALRWAWALMPWRRRQLTSRAAAVGDVLSLLGPRADGSSIRSPEHSVGATLSNGGLRVKR